MPNIVAAQNKGPIKVGMPSVFSGVFALLGQSSSAGARMEIDKIIAAGGINGRKLELITRDSKGKPDEATKVVRDLVNSEGCEIILDTETSASAFAVQELLRELGVLRIHTNSETTSLTANPKLYAPTCFRSARQGIHDAIGGGRYAADIVTKKNQFKFVTAAPDYAYGRENTASFMEYAKIFQPKIDVLDQAWPKLFQPDFTEVVNKIINAKPQALYTALFAGDLVALIEQGLLYGMFDKMETFSVNLGDYGVLTQVKEFPAGLHSGTPPRPAGRHPDPGGAEHAFLPGRRHPRRRHRQGYDRLPRHHRRAEGERGHQAALPVGLSGSFNRFPRGRAVSSPAANPPPFPRS